MKFYDFLKENYLHPNLEIREANKFYSDSNDKIIYVFSENGFINFQDYLVLSHNAAQAYRKKEIKILDLEATYSKESGIWGLVLPPNYRVLETIDLTLKNHTAPDEYDPDAYYGDGMETGDSNFDYYVQQERMIDSIMDGESVIDD